MKKHYAMNKYASIINRLSMMYYDHCLEQEPLSSGQMFFLLRISECEGMSILELSSSAYFDKGTTTRAVQRLEELKYIQRKNDTYDKRVQRLYLTGEGINMIPIIKKALVAWEEIILSGLSEEEIELCEKLMIHMSDNACSFIEKRKKEVYERNHHK